MTTEQEMENIVDPVYTDNSNTLNPLQKLMEGFCSPTKMMTSNRYGDEDDGDDDEDDNDRTADKYAPDLAPSQTTQIPNHEEEKGAEHVIGLTDSDQDQRNCTDEVGTIKSNSPKSISELTTDGLTNDTSKAPTNPSPTSPDTTTATTTTTTTTTTKQESRPEIEVSKRVTMMRRKRGIENFIMTCIFVLTTLLSLKKLGFTTTDFGDFISIVGGSGGSNNYDDTGSSSSSLKSWIHIFDKKSLSIEKGKIEVKETVTTTTTTTEEQPSIDETETPPESVPAAEEKGTIDEEDATEDDSYDSYDDDDEEDATEDDSYDSYDDDDEEKD